MQIGYIYKIVNKINNKIYIGQTIDVQKRWWKHTSVANTNFEYNSYLYNAMRKYGADNFYIELIEECDINIMNDRESYWIEKLNSFAPNGYNLTIGGNILFGENNPFYNKKHTEETKQKISKANTGRKATEEEIELRKIINKKERNPFFGKHHTDESKEKIKNTNILNGSYLRASIRMKNNNPNSSGNLFKKKVLMKDKENNILKEFQSLTDAGNYIKSLGLSNAIKPLNSIVDVCKGRQKTAYGYNWEYSNK